MRAPRNRRWLVVQIVIAVVVIVSIGWALIKQWRDFRDTPLTADPQWGYIVLSAAVVLVTYGVLIETWRRMLVAWGQSLSFADAVRITCVSKLGIYVPGRVWQIGAMSLMAEQARVSPAAAGGSAIISTAVNIAVGIVVALVAGWRGVNAMSGGYAAIGVALAVLMFIGIVLLPTLLPFALERLRRWTGKQLAVGDFPNRAVYIAIVGNVIAWTLYGVAFQVFTKGVLGVAQGDTSAYIAAYAASYIIGYLVVFVPGGFGVREAALTMSLKEFGLADPKQAAVVAVTSRLWLSVLEIVPGLYYWARRTPPRSEETRPADGTTR